MKREDEEMEGRRRKKGRKGEEWREIEMEEGREGGRERAEKGG